MSLQTKIRDIASVGDVNPVRDYKKIFKVLLIGERASVYVSAVVSGFAFAAWGWNFAGDLWDNFFFKSSVAITILIASTYFTDVAIKYIFQNAAYDFFVFFKFKWIKDLKNGDTRFSRGMQFVVFCGMVAVGYFMFMLDFWSVDAVKTAVADVVRQDTLINQAAEVAKVDGQEAARVEAVITAIEMANIDLKNYADQIEKEKLRIASKYDKGVELYKSNNAWFFNKRLNKDFAKSSRLKQLNAQIDQTNANLTLLNKQKIKDIALRSERVTKTNATISALNTSTAAANLQRASGAQNMTKYLGVGAKGLAIGIRILLVAMFLAYIFKDVNNDGKIDSTDVDAAAQMGFQKP